MPTVEKVTAFITRASNRELLLFRHPHAGIQIPAGTVETGETPLQAARREASEETGLDQLVLARSLGAISEHLPPGLRVMAETAVAYARPDPGSFDWATIRKGVAVRVERQAGGFTQVTYLEEDDISTPHYISYQITGWVANESLAETRVRHFFQFDYQGERAGTWEVETDHHRFALFWASLDNLPEIVPAQAAWLEKLK